MIRYVFVLSLMLTTAGAVFNPTLTVDSCTKSKLVLSLTDGADLGIIYIQGQGAACKQTTAIGTNVHEFDFASCGIQWEESFKIIVQKKSLYQTGDDKQIPIMCVADLSDLTVDNGLNALDKDDDAGQNLTVKPTASMKLYSNGQDVGGGNVQLTDLITMTIELGSDYIQDFDLKAKSCYASTIPIIDSSCATDVELFPHFSHPTQGLLSATFGAFRTTDLNGGSVGMTFSCTLEVCLGSCTPEVCSDGMNSWGRKKRNVYDLVVSGSGHDIKKRQAEGGDAIDDINVGAALKISTEAVVIKNEEDDNDVCMDKSAFAVGVVAVLGGLAATCATSAVLLNKVLAKKRILKSYETGMKA